MTLIEVLVVVALMAIAATGTAFAFGALGRTQLRSACMKVAAATRFAYNRAIADGRTMRLVIDTDAHDLSIEEAQGEVSLAAADDPRRAETEGDHDEAAVDPWAAAEARLEETFEPSFGRSPFRPLTGPDGEVLDRYRNVALGDGIRVVKLIVPHEPEPRESGQGAIYFFPSGMTERAVVQLSDAGGRIYSVEVHPLTGRAKVYDRPYEPEEIGEEGFNEVEDPG